MRLNKIIAATLSLYLIVSLATDLVQDAQAANDIDDIGQGAELIKRTEDITSKKWGVTQNIQFDFIKDRKYNKDALVVKMQGFINSRTMYTDHKKYKYIKRMIWPFQYNISLSTKDSKVDLINYLPKNKIDSEDVSQTIGYNIGGNFQTSPSIGGSSSYNYSKTINYNQQNYISEIEQQNSKGIKWGIKANSFVTENGQLSAYDKNLFVRYNPSINNARGLFVPDNELPPLVQSGFNPSFITTLSHEKNASETSEFEITYGRNLDATFASLRSVTPRMTRLVVERERNAFVDRNFTVTYEVNWKTHEIKVKGHN